MIRPALTILGSIFIAACGGGSSTEQNLAPAEDLARQVDIKFINITGDAIDYFVKESSSTTPLMDDSNRVVANSDDQISSYTYKWTTNNALIVDIGALDTNSQSEVGKIENIVTNDNESFWAISWIDDDLTETVFSSFKQQPSSQTDKYVVRVFSSQDTKVEVIKPLTDTMDLDLLKGQMTNQIILDNCIAELYLNITEKRVIDICHLESGKSYLLVTDGETLLAAAEEK